MEEIDEENKNVTITIKEYKRLIKANRILEALYELGVDNWEGYEEIPKELFEE